MDNKDNCKGLNEEFSGKTDYKQWNSVDHDGVHSIAGKENNDSVTAPTTEAITSLSCRSADIYEQSTSNSDSSDMGFNVNAGAAIDMDGTKTSTDRIELASGIFSKLSSRKRDRSDDRNRETFVSSSDNEDTAETKIKHAKTIDTSFYVSSCSSPLTDVEASVGTIACENASEPLATENERSEIALENVSTSDNVRVVAGAECSNNLEDFELATTDAPSAANEEDTAIRAVDETDTPPVSHRRDGEDDSAVEGEGSPARSRPENADLVINGHDPSEDYDRRLFRNQDYRFYDFSRRLYVRNSSDDDSDTDDVMLNYISAPEQAQIAQEVLNKPKPAYTWNSINELRRREHGLCGTERYSSFNTRFYSSRHVVERMKISHKLIQHIGCVNCLNFNRSGNVLCSGSDDKKIIVWDWAKNKIKFSYDSGHKENVFESKFVEGSNSQGFEIISSGLDRQIRYAVIPPSGGHVKTSCLYEHEGPVHKFVICPRSPREIISVGEDGLIQQFDLREKTATLSQTIRNDKQNALRLFGISHHPFKPEIIVCGCDSFVRVFDIRHMNEAVYKMCPMHLLETKRSQVTSCVYNSTGSEVLASYGDEDIYLFNNTCYEKGEFLHQYRGRYNNKSIKGVNFFGLNAEFIISGSDCSSVFFWAKNTEAILNCMPGDTMGVNCLETHPNLPILATSGLDPNVKIWAPISESYPPDLSMLRKRLRRNLSKSGAGTAVSNSRLHYIFRELLGFSGR